MSDGTFRGLWIDEIYRTPLLSAEVKVFLLYLARFMSPDGRVSIPRADLAEGLNCYERRISEKYSAAIEAGFLKRIARGQKGRTALYRAIGPGLPTGDHARQGADTRHPDDNIQSAGRPHSEPELQGAKNPHPERLQGAGYQHPKAEVQGAKNPHPEEPRDSRQGAGTPHPERVGPYEDRARAHSNGDRSDDSLDESGDEGAVVVALFEEKTPSLRSKKPPARKRGKESSADDPKFAEFWSAYPRKVGKPSGRKAWDKAMKRNADPELIILAARRFATDPRRSISDIKFTPHPSTWLNDERYLDEPEAPPGPVADPRRPVLDGTDAKVAAWLAAADRLEAQEQQ